VHVMSFEKRERALAGGDSLARRLKGQGIEWTALTFTKSYGKLGKLWDLLRMHAKVWELCNKHDLRIVHCRSYLAMQAACFVQTLLPLKTVFDMRSLWVDERVDGGLWPQSRWINRQVFRAYKRIEHWLFISASHVVVLTHATLPELNRIAPEMTAAVTVIPCCADFNHFRLRSHVQRCEARRQLGIQEDSLVLSYLGSLGTWYMLEEMLRFFAIAARRSDVHFLIVTQDWDHTHERLLVEMGLQGLRPRIHVRGATRDEVPSLIGSSDIMLSFIRPSYSKLASSPTKLAEAFAMGVPVISSSGVGDVQRITEELDAGAIIDTADEANVEWLAGELEQIRQKGGPRLREAARREFGLEVATERYRHLYSLLDPLAGCRGATTD
jgi:glycosyltransferase involved in cell wall biosynthesis